MATVNASNKLFEIDDTIPLTCTFIATETEGDHVVYIIKVTRGFDTKYSWEIRKRYSEFDELNSQLKLFNYELPLPPKKAFGNMKREFLSTRQIGLQVYNQKTLRFRFISLQAQSIKIGWNEISLNHNVINY